MRVYRTDAAAKKRLEESGVLEGDIEYKPKKGQSTEAKQHHLITRGLPHHNQAVTVNPQREPTAMRVGHHSRAHFGLFVCFFTVIDAVRWIAEAGGLSVSMVTPHGGKGGGRLKVIC